MSQDPVSKWLDQAGEVGLHEDISKLVRMCKVMRQALTVIYHRSPDDFATEEAEHALKAVEEIIK